MRFDSEWMSYLFRTFSLHFQSSLMEKLRVVQKGRQKGFAFFTVTLQNMLYWTFTQPEICGEEVFKSLETISKFSRFEEFLKLF